MKKLIEKLRRDSWGMGVFLGLVVPAITFAIFLGLFALALHLAPRTEAIDVFDINTICKIVLLSMVPSVFVMRYYLLKLKYDYTGRGILLMTFLIAIVFTILNFVN